MTVRPKYIATVEFSCSNHHFIAGDEVTDPIVIESVTQFGDRFVTTDTARARKGTSANADPAEASTPTTVKES